MTVKRNWIVVHSELKRFECLRCGQTYDMRLPCSINIMLAAMEAFTKDHKNCKEFMNSKPVIRHRDDSLIGTNLAGSQREGRKE